MSNRRSIMFFLFGSIALCVFLWGLSHRAAVVATVRSRSTISIFDPEEVVKVEVKSVGKDSDSSLVIEKQSSSWRITSPFSAETDPAAVARLLDSVTLSPIADMLTLEDIRGLGYSLADFGLAPARISIALHSATRQERILIGGSTPSGKEVYARSEDLRNVFTISSEVFDVATEGVDSLRRLSLVSCSAEEVTGLEFKIPDTPFVKLIREGKAWRIHLPASAPADSRKANSLVERLVASRVDHFVWQVSSKASPSSLESKPSADLLASYGLDPASPSAFAVTVRKLPDSSDQIVFGKPAASNLVYALVQNGSAVAAVDSSLAELCRVSEADLRDTRLFPCSATDVRSITITTPESVMYRLVQYEDRLWRMDAPVNAPADPASSAWLVDAVLRLRHADLAEGGVGVAVSTSGTNMPAVTVSIPELNRPGMLANLRAKTLFAIEKSSVRRLLVKTASGATAVEWDAERGAWDIMPTGSGDDSAKPAPKAVNPAAVARLLDALVEVKADSVEKLSATSADFVRCGLDNPAFTVAVDLSGGKVLHREVVIGGAAPGGGRYATVGGADAVFVLSPSTVAALTASITE